MTSFGSFRTPLRTLEIHTLLLPAVASSQACKWKIRVLGAGKTLHDRRQGTHRVERYRVNWLTANAATDF